MAASLLPHKHKGYSQQGFIQALSFIQTGSWAHWREEQLSFLLEMCLHVSPGICQSSFSGVAAGYTLRPTRVDGTRVWPQLGQCAGYDCRTIC